MSTLRNVLAAFTSLTLAACSHLEVKTAVYIRDFQEIQERASIIRRSIEEVLACDPTGDVDVFARLDEDKELNEKLRKELTSIQRDLAALAPTANTFEADSFAAAYLDTIRTIPRRELDRSKLRDLVWSAKLLESDPPYFHNPVILQEKFRALDSRYRAVVETVNQPFVEMAAAADEDFGKAIWDFYSPLDADGIAALVKDPLAQSLVGKSDKERKDLITAAEKQADRLSERLKNLGSLLFPAEAQLVDKLEASTEQLAVLPLADPNVPRIVNAPDYAWEGLYNHVVGHTNFGNAEIAIRMESLGEFHMKGVVFDPSKVTKATLDGIDMAVQIAAAASGVPLPTTSDGDAAEKGNGDQTLVSKAALRAQISQLRKQERERRVVQTEGFYKLLGHLRALPPKDQNTTIATELRTLAGKLKPAEKAQGGS